jgi:4'-phosphopantetheinyl transferase
MLSADELARADRFKFEKDRLHYLAARGMLRRLLGGFLGVGPSEIRFKYSHYNKPSLAEEFESSGIRFNVSHSGGRVMMAFACGREVGIDIERIRPDFATDDIAERFFSAYEIERLRALPAEQRTEAFFTCWTRKEAFIKAIGEGLSCPLDKFDVTLGPGEPATLVATRVEGQPASRWSMRSLDAGNGFKSAIVVEGNDWDLVWEDWAP